MVGGRRGHADVSRAVRIRFDLHLIALGAHWPATRLRRRRGGRHCGRRFHRRAATAATVTVGIGRLRLADGEPLGLLGVSYIAELVPGWWLDPAIYGAFSGDRGGLFTWGVEGQRR